MDDDKVSPNFTVRPLNERDLPFARELFPDARRHLASDRHNSWLVQKAGEIVGIAVVVIENDALAHLMYLHVRPNCRNHRDATLVLAEFVLRHAWDRGYLKLVIHDRPAEPTLVSFLHELGFEFSRVHAAGHEHVVEFYRNLYEPPRNRLSHSGTNSI